MSSENGWSEYQHLILAELERHNRWMSDVDSKVTSIVVDMALLKKMHEGQEKFNQMFIQRQENFEREINDRLQTLETLQAEEEGRSEVRRWVANIAISFMSAVGASLCTYLIING